MLDSAFVRRKIKLIQEDLGRLEGLAAYRFDELEQDFVKMGAVERLLEKIIMRAIDINQHLIAELGTGRERIKGYEDTFYALAELGVYDGAFAKEIAPSAGLRNRLVHEYNDTKDEIIYGSVRDALAQYAQYSQHILAFVDRKETV